MSRSVLPFAFLCLVVPLAAQTNSVVVPPRALTVRPGSVWRDAAHQNRALWGSSGPVVYSRTQFLYAARDIGVLPLLLRGVSFRAPYDLSQAAATYTTTIVVSDAPISPAAALPDFARNHGPSPTTVFSGPLNLPATFPVTWPQPFVPMIPFVKAVPWSGVISPSLVLDYQTSASSNGRSWTMEGVKAEYGYVRAVHSQPNCRHSGGGTSSGWGWDGNGLVVGGMFQLRLTGYPLNPSLSTNALFFGVSGPGSPFGSFVTPFALTGLGLPAPANCSWSIGVLGAGYPMTQTASISGADLLLANVRLPSTAAFGGAVFYTQNLALDVDPVLGTPNLFPSIALEWHIGTGNRVACSTVAHVSASGIPKQGGVWQSEGAVTQFWY